MKKTFIIFVSVLINLSISAQSLDYAKSVIDTLCSKTICGRGYVKNGDKKAANYIKQELENVGVDALIQPFKFDINTFEKEQNLEINKKKQILGVDYILNSASGSGTGKFKVVDYNKFVRKPNFAPRAIKITSEEYKNVSKDKLKFSQLLKSDIIIKTDVKKLTASLSRFQLPTTIIESKLSKKEIKKVEFSSEAKLIKNYESQNVIGHIKGSEYPDSLLIICAHYDHLGGMGEIYFPGANDNAAGIAMLLELAKYYKENPHKYSVMFIAFGGEEAGLLGSKHFVENRTVDLKKVKFLMNVDLVGTGSEGITVVNGKIFKNYFEKLKSINDEKQYLPKIKVRGKAANSDHYYFSEKGVPSFFIYAMGPPPHYHDINDNGSDLGLEKFKEIQQLIIDFYK